MYPQVIHFGLGFSTTNHPAIGDPPFLESLIWGIPWEPIVLRSVLGFVVRRLTELGVSTSATIEG
jgi:hypothetical protein